MNPNRLSALSVRTPGHPPSRRTERDNDALTRAVEKVGAVGLGGVLRELAVASA